MEENYTLLKKGKNWIWTGYDISEIQEKINEKCFEQDIYKDLCELIQFEIVSVSREEIMKKLEIKSLNNWHEDDEGDMLSDIEYKLCPEDISYDVIKRGNLIELGFYTPKKYFNLVKYYFGVYNSKYTKNYSNNLYDTLCKYKLVIELHHKLFNDKLSLKVLKLIEKPSFKKLFNISPLY